MSQGWEQNGVAGVETEGGTERCGRGVASVTWPLTLHNVGSGLSR